ncbi:hypothetical protein [Spongiimicrobium salis]|uniref:hypothetical protein n=1 Tax=Spongiimicrobium salis TaxID=1667022 RepID=UPI00374D84F6
MKKYRTLFSIVFLFVATFGYSQNKEEREHRILCGQFPKKAVATVKTSLEGVRNLKYYKEIGSTYKTYTAKFKKDKLAYRMDFDTQGNMQNIGYLIKEADIPEETYTAIDTYLEENFEKPKARRMIQQYLSSDFNGSEDLMKTAFQNILSPKVEYKFIITAKSEGFRQYFEVLFNAKGEVKNMRKSPAANYDHVLY